MKANKLWIFFGILLLAIGFASVSTILYLSGVSNIVANVNDFDIYFSESILDDEDVSTETISTDGKTIDFKTKNLSMVGDKSKLVYEVTNNSTMYDAEVSIKCNNYDTDMFNLTFETPSVIEAKTKGRGSIEVALKHNVDEAAEFDLECTIDSKATGRTSVATTTAPADAPSTYTISGYMMDENDIVIPNATLVMYSDTPHYIEADNYGYVYATGLEAGTHEIYYLEEITMENIKKKDKNNIKLSSKTFTNLTTSSKKLLFPNGYKIGDLKIVQKTNATYDITLDPNGGELEDTSYSVTENNLYGEIPTPTRVGYTFDGWYLNDKLIKNDNYVTLDVTHTLVAKWTGKGYTVSFNSQGGNIVADKNVVFGDKYGELTSPTYTGYTFKGWFTNLDYTDEITSETIVSTAESHTLFARWEANEYNVNFVANGGTSVEAIKVTYDSKYSNLPTSEKTGYSLSWCLDDALQTCINNETIVKTASDHTLYAKWTAEALGLTLNVNGGKETYEVRDLTYDQPYGELPNPTRDGYTFVGWFTELSSGTEVKGTDIVKVTGSQTIYAHWDALTYTIEFNANGGSTVTTIETVTYDSEYGFTMPTTEREGHSFDGWFTEETGGEQVTTTSIVKILKNTVLYAHWTVLPYDFDVTINEGIDKVYYKVEGESTYLNTAATLSKKYDYGTKLLYYAEPEIGYVYESCTADSPCSATMGITGITYSPVATRVTASLIAFNNTKSGSTCTDMQCAIDELSAKLQ